MEERLERTARNESLFREVNDRIEELSENVEAQGIAPEGGLIEFHCECGRDGCTERVRMTVEEYQRVRADNVGRPEEARPYAAGRPHDRRLRAEELPDHVSPRQAHEARVRPRVVADGAAERLGPDEPRTGGGAAPDDEEGRARPCPPEQPQHAARVRTRPVV